MPRRKTVKTRLDRLDMRLLASLAEHGRQPIAELAKAVSRSASPCSTRLARLESEQLIRGYRADIDVERLAELSAYYVTLACKSVDAETVRRIETLMAQSPYIVAADCLFGSIDYLLLVYARSTQHYHEIMTPFDQFNVDYETWPVSRRLIRFSLHRLVAELGRDID